MGRSPPCWRIWKRSGWRHRPGARGRTRRPPAEAPPGASRRRPQGPRDALATLAPLTQAAHTPGPEVRAYRSDEMMFQGELDHLALGMHPKFAQNSLEMVAYRNITDPQCLGNLPRRLALDQEAEDFFFPGR